VINGDDEVALFHGDEASNFQPMSLPLVNIRATVARAVREEELDEHTGCVLIEVGRNLYYPERTVPALLAGLIGHGFTEEALAHVKALLTDNLVDLKGEDAKLLLASLRRVVDGLDRLPPIVEFDFARSGVFQTLYNLDRRVERGGSTVSLEDIAEHVAMYEPDYREIRRCAMDRAVTVCFGIQVGLTVSEEEVEEERGRFLRSHGIGSHAAEAEWLDRNAWSVEDLDDYATEEAMCMKLRRWVARTRSFDRGAKDLLDELRRRGTFPGWAEAAGEKQAILRAYSGRPEYQLAEMDPSSLAAMHERRNQVEIRGDAGLWATDAGLDGVRALAAALERAYVYDDVLGRMARQVRALEGAESAVLEQLVALPVPGPIESAHADARNDW
jgi:TfuA-like protein